MTARWLLRLLMFTGAAQTAYAQSLAVEADAGLRVGVAQPIDVTRTGLGAITVTVATSSAGGELSLGQDPLGTWSGTVDVSFSSSQVRATVYYRDGVSGPVTLSASAAGYTSAMQPAVVSLLGFIDDAESGGLLYSGSPPGAWNNLNPIAGTAIAPAAAAAHRGAMGLRMTDGSSIAGSGNCTQVDYVMAPISGTAWGRAWVKIQPDSGVGELEVFTLSQGQASRTLAAIDVTLPGGALSIPGEDVSGDRTSSTPFRVDGGWHLFELELTGLGTPDGGRRVWMDRVLVHSSALDWGSPLWRLSAVSVGQPWSQDRRFTGHADFDDVGVSVSPPPSLLRLSAPAAVRVGECAPATVSLHDSQSSAPANALYEVHARVGSASSGIQLFDDALCTRPIADVVIPAGAPSASFYVRATGAGTARASALADDFFIIPADISVLPGDAGPDLPDGGLEPRLYAAGCGCDATGPGLLLAAWSALIRRRRPPRLSGRAAEAAAAARRA